MLHAFENLTKFPYLPRLINCEINTLYKGLDLGMEHFYRGTKFLSLFIGSILSFKFCSRSSLLMMSHNNGSIRIVTNNH